MKLIERLDPERRLRVGFATGTVISILVAAGVLGAVHLTSAEGSPATKDTARTSSASADDSFGGVSEPAPGSNAAPAPVTTAPATPVTTTASAKYVALGDSVGAGLGLPLIANPTTQDTTCGRSSQAYGYEVSRQLNLPGRLFACSGATAGDLLTRQRITGTDPQAQLTAAYEGGAPTLISITAGANDARWATFIKKCYAYTCGGTSDTRLANGALLLMQTKYKAALESIRLRAFAAGTEPPRVVLTGYYNPLSEQCLNSPLNTNNRLTQAELTWLSGSVNALNKTISDLATSYGSFARYAPVDFAGHDLCSANPWIQGLDAAAPVHPTAAGQQAIARSVVNAAR